MNTRFGVLLDEMKSPNKNEKKDKDKKDEERNKEKPNHDDKYKDRDLDREKNRNRDKDRNRDKSKDNRKYENKIFQAPVTQNKKPSNYVFNEMSFPELGSMATTQSQSQTQTHEHETNYLDAINKTNDAEIDNKNLEETEVRTVGWIYYMREKHTNKTIICDHSIIENSVKQKQTERQLINKTYEDICEKYFQWKNKYIETWGYDQYEKIYLFSNYDYKYFDRLDYLNEYELNEYYKHDGDWSESDMDYMYDD